MNYERCSVPNLPPYETGTPPQYTFIVLGDFVKPPIGSDRASHELGVGSHVGYTRNTNTSHLNFVSTRIVLVSSGET